ncbi:MAG: hypothetical protein JW881_01495 [Spirochaetales bacterium]|nr:hypothetical protein [Spirochaetales bacterium]
MKKLTIILILCAAACSLSAQPLRIGYYQFEPYIIFQGKNQIPGGPIAEYWQEYLIPALKTNVEWIGPLPLLRLQKYFENGGVDAILVFPKDDSLTGRYRYPQSPFMIGRPGLSFLKDYPITAVTRKSDLYDMEISYVKGGFLPPFLESEAIIIDYTTKEKYLATNLDILLKKRVDAVFALDVVTILYEADKHGRGDQIKTFVLPTEYIGLYTVFSSSEQGQKMLRLYNPANDRLYREGVFETLTEKYIPENYRKAGR